MSAQKICVVQAGLRSELDIATDEMERAQRQLAALEKQREVLQQGSAAASPRAAPAATANSALEDSLRKELQTQVNSVLCSATRHQHAASQYVTPSSSTHVKQNCLNRKL